MSYFERLDDVQFLDIKIWDFSFRSLLREYGKEFFTKIIVKHPIRTTRGIQRYRRMIREKACISEVVKGDWPGNEKAIVGVGFCLKPLEPACISGRANHECVYFERNLHLADKAIPDCCKECMIRTAGMLALAAGNSFYIMTSALDILRDMLVPALDERRFTHGLYALCRYSFDPFQLALFVVGIKGNLYPYASGDCKDYETWLKADIGFKEERTVLDPGDFEQIKKILVEVSQENSASRQYKKIGNIFYPQ